MSTVIAPSQLSTSSAQAAQPGALIIHTAILTGRHLRAFMRMPVYLVMNLVQPIIWLLLFGQLFKSVINIPGFASAGVNRAGSYLEYLTPGIVMMMALFGAAWAGTTYIDDMNRGVMDRFLTSPTSRVGLVISTMLYQAVLTILQTLIVLGVAWWAGARFDGGVGGILILLVSAVLLTFVFSAFSNAIALLARTQTALIGISQLISLPLMFLSSAIMNTKLSPAWVGNVAHYNPFEWAVVAGRQALQSAPDLGAIWANLGLLAALVVVMTWLATLAFRSYQRSA
ncbi:MAG TPA: ABC transporter permease [Microbacteriaceae bacterium]